MIEWKEVQPDPVLWKPIAGDELIGTYEGFVAQTIMHLGGHVIVNEAGRWRVRDPYVANKMNALAVGVRVRLVAVPNPSELPGDPPLAYRVYEAVERPTVPPPPLAVARDPVTGGTYPGAVDCAPAVEGAACAAPPVNDCSPGDDPAYGPCKLKVGDWGCIERWTPGLDKCERCIQRAGIFPREAETVEAIVKDLVRQGEAPAADPEPTAPSGEVPGWVRAPFKRVDHYVSGTKGRDVAECGAAVPRAEPAGTGGNRCSRCVRELAFEGTEPLGWRAYNNDTRQHYYLWWPKRSSSLPGKGARMITPCGLDGVPSDAAGPVGQPPRCAKCSTWLDNRASAAGNELPHVGEWVRVRRSGVLHYVATNQDLSENRAYCGHSLYGWSPAGAVTVRCAKCEPALFIGDPRSRAVPRGTARNSPAQASPRTPMEDPVVTALAAPEPVMPHDGDLALALLTGAATAPDEDPALNQRAEPAGDSLLTDLPIIDQIRTVLKGFGAMEFNRKSLGRFLWAQEDPKGVLSALRKLYSLGEIEKRRDGFYAVGSGKERAELTVEALLGQLIASGAKMVWRSDLVLTNRYTTSSINRTLKDAVALGALSTGGAGLYFLTPRTPPTHA